MRCVALEPRASAAALAGWRGEWQPCDSPQALARVVAGLDAVVSVDTMAAHLAGALGAPACTLLACDADWRWMNGRDDTPWYPTMRLFRQPAPGAWEPVLADVARHLASSASPIRAPVGRPGGAAMPTRDLVVIGASAGGLQALYTILAGLPASLPAAVVAVIHTRSTADVLPQILRRRSSLKVETARDGAELVPGTVYVPPADRHVGVSRKGLRVVRGRARTASGRPSIRCSARRREAAAPGSSA